MMKMKPTIVLISMLMPLHFSWAQNHSTFFKESNSFFGQFVKDGRVNYSAVKSNQGSLNSLLSYLNTNGTWRVQNNADKALLINAYNLFVIKGIVDNYPTKSPLSLPSFFDNKLYDLGGKKISLNQLEKEVLLKQTKDARLHFVLVCAAVGCPPIADFAYEPSKLESQLDERTRMAMNSSYFTRVRTSDKTVELSKIFEWYAADFKQNDKSLLDFVNKFRSEPIPLNYKVSHYEYDWNLNDSKELKGAVEQDFVPLNNAPPGSSNILQFTPSQLFAKGQYEINVFNNLYSQTAFRDKDGNEIDAGVRQSILTSTFQFTYGVSKRARVNVGVDAVVAGGSNGPKDGSLFQFFGGNTFSREVTLSHIGPRVKFQPVKKWRFYSVQSTFLFPVAGDLEQRGPDNVFTALNRYSWNTQFLYDFKITEEFRIFYQFAVNYWIRRNQDEVFFPTNFVDLPSTIFINYFPTTRLNPFIFGQYNGRYGRTDLRENPESRFGLLQTTWQLGAGAKYQLTDHINLEISYGNFLGSRGFKGIEGGAGETINFALRFIK